MLGIAAGSALAGASLTVFAATPAVPPLPNRDPVPGEVGYRPADGSTSRLNPPSFVWLHEPEAVTYTLEWDRSPEFRAATRAEGLPWNTHTASSTMSPGRVYWRYRYATRDGRQSGWSRIRSVIVPPGATEMPMPTPAQQRERVPAVHPRLFLRPEHLPRLRRMAGLEPSAAAGAIQTGGGEEEARARAAFGRVRAAAEALATSGVPTPEPVHRGSARNKNDAEAVKYWWPNREQTLKACQEAETLAFVWMLTRDPRIGAAARTWIRHLASWDPDGPTQFALNCEAAKPLLHRLSRAYDWAFDTLDDPDRRFVRERVARRVEDAWKSGEVGRGTGHLNRPYGSHANRTWHKIGESGIVFLGEIPEAAQWLDYAVNTFHAVYPVWSDDDGGWHEGVSYWAGYLGKVVWWLQAADAALGIDGLRKPFFSQVGDFPLYVAPPGSPNMGFGDLSYQTPSRSWGGFTEYFVRAKGAQPDGGRAAQWRWWMERWNMTGQEGILGFLYAANLPPLPTGAPPDAWPSSRVFEGIGVASLHTTLRDGLDDVHLLFKSSPFGTQSHGHNAHNTFQLNAYGEALLPACVYRDLHGSRFHTQWAHSTLAQNGLLVDGRGQVPHSPAPHGRMASSSFGPDADHVVGDATAAYGDRLTRYRRHAVLVKGAAPFVVLLDDVAARQPARFQLLLHALGPFQLDAGRTQLALRRPRAGLRVDYQAGQTLTLRQWDGYDPQPTRNFPNQWHVEASTVDPATEALLLTVAAPSRGDSLPDLRTERLSSPTAVGVRVTVGAVTRTVAFARPGREADARLDDRPISGGFAVW